MGNYLTSPNSVKHSENGELGRFRFGACGMQGWRVTMEDAHLHHYFERLDPADTSAALFGIYDGHGGAQVAQYVARHIAEELVKHPDFRKGRFDNAFRATYIALDHMLCQESSQPELDWFSRAPQECIGEASPFPPVPHTTTSADMAAATAKQQPVETPHGRHRFRNSMKISGKKLYKRVGHNDKRQRKVDLNGDKDAKDAAKDATKDVAKDTPTSNSPPLSASTPTVDCDSSTSELRASSNSGTSSSTDTGEADAQKGGDELHTADGNGSSGGSHLFSLQGIRSLLVGMMKFGSPGRANHTPHGLAMFAGCTAVSVLLTDSQIVVANAGDSRCVLCRGDVAVELSKDHKPQLPEERARIYSAGGWLEMGRVNGNLNLSRALGDLVYKVNTSLPPDRQIVSPVPDVIIADLTDQDEFLILGCDGIWESSTSQEVVDFIRERLEDAANISDVLEALFEELLSPNPTLFEFGCDNMTAIIVDLWPERRWKRSSVPRPEQLPNSNPPHYDPGFAPAPTNMPHEPSESQDVPNLCQNEKSSQSSPSLNPSSSAEHYRSQYSYIYGTDFDQRESTSTSEEFADPPPDPSLHSRPTNSSSNSRPTKDSPDIRFDSNENVRRAQTLAAPYNDSISFGSTQPVYNGMKQTQSQPELAPGMHMHSDMDSGMQNDPFMEFSSRVNPGSTTSMDLNIYDPTLQNIGTLSDDPLSGISTGSSVISTKGVDSETVEATTTGQTVAADGATPSENAGLIKGDTSNKVDLSNHADLCAKVGNRELIGNRVDLSEDGLISAVVSVTSPRLPNTAGSDSVPISMTHFET